MSIQSQPQIADNQFVVMAIMPWSGDPTRNIVTLQALVPAANTQASAVGQSYNLSNTTLNSNAGSTVLPGPAAFPLGRA